MNISMMAGIDAIRKAPNLSLITQLPSDGLVMSSGRKRIYNAYVAGMRDIENIAKSTKLSDSFVGVTLRRLSEVGMIKREINMKKGGVEGKQKRKVKCLNLIKSGVVDVAKLTESMGLSRGATCKYLLELRGDGKIVYMPGSLKKTAIIKIKEVV